LLGAGRVGFQVALKTVSEANQRGDWRAKHRRSATQRATVRAAAHALLGRCVVTPCVVTLTRLSARELDDDNLSSAFKAVRDGLADYLGVDDLLIKLVRYEYAQERAKGYAVRVEFRPMEQTA
jgi:hypothetical protein